MKIIFRKRRTDRVIAKPTRLEFTTYAGRKVFFPAILTLIRKAA